MGRLIQSARTMAANQIAHDPIPLAKKIFGNIHVVFHSLTFLSYSTVSVVEESFPPPIFPFIIRENRIGNLPTEIGTGDWKCSKWGGAVWMIRSFRREEE